MSEMRRIAGQGSLRLLNYTPGILLPSKLHSIVTDEFMGLGDSAREEGSWMLLDVTAPTSKREGVSRRFDASQITKRAALYPKEAVWNTLRVLVIS